MEEVIAAALEAIYATDVGAAAQVPEEAMGPDGRIGDGARNFGHPREWGQFCQRVLKGTATPSCVIDFPYADAGQRGLNLQGDDRLLERMFCFHDPLDQDPSRRMVVLHVHTLLRWGDRMQWTAASRLQEVTSVNARHATRPAVGGTWTQERCKFFVVPKNKSLQAWQTLFTSGGKGRIVWSPYTAGSVPAGDPGADWRYEELRKVIHAGDSLCQATQVTFNLTQTAVAMRSGEEIEYEIVGVMGGVELATAPTATGITSASTDDHRKDATAHRKKVLGVRAPNSAAGSWIEETVWANLPPPPPTPAERYCILFVGANNNDEARLSLEREVKGMRQAFTAQWGSDAWRHVVTFEILLHANMKEMVDRLLDLQPVVVHFACHGQHSALSLYQDAVSVQKLTDAFATWAGETGGGALRLVVANACYSANLATALSEHVAFVIGHHTPVQDAAAVQFAEVLYKALGTGASLLQSFKVAKTTAGCDKYCLQGRWNADKFVFAKPSTLSAHVHEVGVGHIEHGQFTRRDAMLQILEDWLETRGSPRTAVVGQGGSGKSTLVQYFLKDIVNSRGGSTRLVFFLQSSDLMGGYRVLLRELQDILGQTGTVPDKDEDVRARVHASLRNPDIKHKWVGVLDDLPWPESLADLHWLLAPSGGEFPWGSGKTIVTSRCRQWMDHNVFGNGFELGNFEVEEAHTFLKDRVGHWRQDAVDGGVAAVARRLAYFPLALTSARMCERIQSLPIWLFKGTGQQLVTAARELAFAHKTHRRISVRDV